MPKKTINEEIIDLGTHISNVNDSIRETIKAGTDLLNIYASNHPNLQLNNLEKGLLELTQTIKRGTNIYKGLASKVTVNKISEMKGNLGFLKIKTKEVINIFITTLPINYLKKEEALIRDVLKLNIELIHSQINSALSVIKNIQEIHKPKAQSEELQPKKQLKSFISSIFSMFNSIKFKKSDSVNEKNKLFPIYDKIFTDPVGYVQGGKIFDKSKTCIIGYIISDKIYSEGQTYPIGYIKGEEIFNENQTFPIGYIQGEKIYDKSQTYQIGCVQNPNITKEAAAFFVIQGRLS